MMSNSYTSIEKDMIDEQLTRVLFNHRPLQLSQALSLSGQVNFERLLAEANLGKVVIGVDEAGRGPLLGGVTVAAVVLPFADTQAFEDRELQKRDYPEKDRQKRGLSQLNDSKKLTQKKREILYPMIQQQSLAFCVADVPAAVIDEMNILQATLLGMKCCIEALLSRMAMRLSFLDVEVLVDGNRCPVLDLVWSHDEKTGDDLIGYGEQCHHIDMQAWVKGDARHSSIAAASILAKVSRDEQMRQLAVKYPNYGIGNHKGYPTKEHLQAIVEHGVLPEHRRTFAPIKKMLYD